MKNFDPADISFFQNLFSGIAEEMGVTLIRTAYSPNIKERRDVSCALFGENGTLVSQAAHIPVHLGAMPMSVEAALSAFGDMREGDIVMLNDPFAGGTHLPDITLVSPVVYRGKISAFLATRAHHADVGGMTPGSLPLSRDIYQEGLRIPPVKLREAGRMNESVLSLLEANSRTPEERLGDIRAQIAAHEVGTARLLETFDRYGAAKIHRHMKELTGYGSRLMRSVIRKIPDGEYRFVDYLDGDGINDGKIKIAVRLTIKGGAAVVDFSGSDPACEGSVNSVESVTRSAVYYCFLCLLATPSPLATGVAGTPPLNGGCFEPVKVNAPAGSIVNAPEGSAVAGGNVETSQRIVDVVFGALAKALPDVIPSASQGTMNNVTLGGFDPVKGKRFAYYETIGGGMGARPGRNGIDGVQINMTNTMNTPVEALEFAYPIRVERYEIVEGTGGAGKFRGGNGIRRDIKLLADAHGTVMSERRRIAPYGLKGGSPGKPGEDFLVRNGKKMKLPGKAEVLLKAGDVLSIRTPGGGGWGKP